MSAAPPFRSLVGPLSTATGAKHCPACRRYQPGPAWLDRWGNYRTMAHRCSPCMDAATAARVARLEPAT